MIYINILQIILGLMFAFLGLSSLVGADKALKNFEHLKLPATFRIITGYVQFLGAVGMFAGLFYPAVSLIAGIWLTLTMIVAVILHFRIKEPLAASFPAVFIGGLALIIVIARLMY